MGFGPCTAASEVVLTVTANLAQTNIKLMYMRKGWMLRVVIGCTGPVDDVKLECRKIRNC